ncbi:tetratricopeptide repeat protein [Streptomyces sp. NPDC005474]|uniref:tetratricopeptide repeat protein n=1 Tax=Streptomyces sp. NPDC005474 TaxID=3154878 RepID=UPI003454DFBC
MAPRTNDDAPDREQASQPPLPRPGRELGTPPTDTAGAPATSPTEPAPQTAAAESEGAAPTGTAGPGDTRTNAERTTPATDTAETPVTPATEAATDDADTDAEGSGQSATSVSAHAVSGPVTSPEASDSGADGHEPDAGTTSPTSDVDVDVHSASDERVAAVRRVGESSRRWRAVQLGACAAALAVAFSAGAMVLGAVRDGGGTTPVSSAPAAMSPALLASGNLDASIASLQAHLRAQPKDFGSWATLGLAYVEQARTKGDPSRYPQAQQALKRSLELKPDNDPALAGRAALAAARHDFPGALKNADQALRQNPYSERALSIRIDALVELGRYDQALKATDEADMKRPGVPVFTRFAYVRELRGDVTTARRVLERALGSATSRGDIAYVATALGQLQWNQGEYKSALEYYARALAADDAYLPALEGRARAQYANGDRADAIKGMEDVVSRYPLPGPLVELGELYEVRGGDGDLAKARAQYALVNAWTAIARANGVNADLDTALAAADHGDRKSALRAARAEWDRRETVHTADALAWALHVNGQDEEALPYARRATATGYRNASFLYHRGVIEQATGHTKEARASLSAALELNPGFSPLGARKARTALKSLEAAK